MQEINLKEHFKSFPAKQVKKGEILLRAGDFTNSAFFVEEGCLRAYIINSNGKEYIYQFAPENWIVSDEEAVLEKKEAIFYIDAIEDSVIKVLNSGDLRSPDMNVDAANKHISGLQRKLNSFRKRIILLLSATAEERYETFIKTYPNLAQRVPLKMIASYIGITPESLSRVRKELVAKK